MPPGNLSTVTDALGHMTKITSYNQRGVPLSKPTPTVW